MPRHLYPKLSWLMTRTKSKKLRKSLFNSLGALVPKSKKAAKAAFFVCCVC
jgi:hypothetical protein